MHSKFTPTPHLTSSPYHVPCTLCLSSQGPRTKTLIPETPGAAQHAISPHSMPWDARKPPINADSQRRAHFPDNPRSVTAGDAMCGQGRRHGSYHGAGSSGGFGLPENSGQAFPERVRILKGGNNSVSATNS